MLCIDVYVESPVWLMGDSSRKNKCGMTYLLLWFVEQIMVDYGQQSPHPLVSAREGSSLPTETLSHPEDELFKGKTPNNCIS